MTQTRIRPHFLATEMFLFLIIRASKDTLSNVLTLVKYTLLDFRIKKKQHPPATIKALCTLYLRTDSSKTMNEEINE